LAFAYLLSRGAGELLEAVDSFLAVCHLERWIMLWQSSDMANRKMSEEKTTSI
jgi:hypothetical protein